MAELLTARDLEAFLKIDAKTMYMYVQKRLLPYLRIQLNVRFIQKEILEWIDKLSFQPNSTNR
jgi:predicted DNA-binding transcriptional regulator AlpA